MHQSLQLVVAVLYELAFKVRYCHFGVLPVKYSESVRCVVCLDDFAKLSK